MNESGLRGLVFLTVHNENGERNPRSVLVVEALQRHILVVEALRQCGCAALVLDSPAEPKLMASADVAVALFDVSYGVNRWSPRPTTTDVAPRPPDWARALSSGSCIAVGLRCVAFPAIVERAACQIATMFSREFRQNKGHEYPWGPAPSPNRRHRRSRVMPHQHYLHSQR